MRFLILIAVILSGTQSFAGAMGRYVGSQMLISLSTYSSMGTADTGPQRLYEVMNRPEQDSMLGPGKALLSEKKVLNFVCNKRGEGNYQCVINIHKTAFSQISANKATFEVRGEMAKAYYDQFHTQGGALSFRDDGNMFAVEATPERFLIVFSVGGV